MAGWGDSSKYISGPNQGVRSWADIPGGRGLPTDYVSGDERLRSMAEYAASAKFPVGTAVPHPSDQDYYRDGIVKTVPSCEGDRYLIGFTTKYDQEISLNFLESEIA